MIIINICIRYITATIKLDELQIAKKSSLVAYCFAQDVSLKFQTSFVNTLISHYVNLILP